MKKISAIVVHPKFDATWPLAADHLHDLWKKQGEVQFIQMSKDDTRPVHEVLQQTNQIQRLVVLSAPFTLESLKAMPQLKELSVVVKNMSAKESDLDETLLSEIKKSGISFYSHYSQGFWGQSVAEFGLTLTLCGLRRVPQKHHAIITDLKPWNKWGTDPSISRKQGSQFCDDDRFTNGTVEGKSIRIVGIGNIASRYASFVKMLGADVAAWDPFASEPCFHRAGARREFHLDELLKDAEIFAPILPLTDKTKGIITEKHINALPKGCLVVLISRATICDMPALRKRVLADELSLAADVFDVEPLPLNDPLLGRHNVVHTPHHAGGTRHANEKWAEMLAEQFLP